MSIKQRAQELLTCDELRGRVPEEVQDFLRDVVALEPVGCVDKGIFEACDPVEWILWGPGMLKPQTFFCIPSEPPMTPREAAAILRQHNEWRRFDGPITRLPKQLPPKLIGEAMDIAAKYIEDNDHE